jgi:Fibronectin type III domain
MSHGLQDRQSHRRRLVPLCLAWAAFILVLASGTLAHALEVSFAWDPNVDPVDGYRVYSRQEGQTYNYSQPAWQGPSTTCTISNLADGVTYYFVARAYNAYGESGDSNEAVYQVGSSVGDAPGWTSFSVRADEQLRLDLNITNSRGDAFSDIKAEWLILTGPVGGGQSPVFVLTSGGQILDVRKVSDFNAVTYSFNHSADVATLATLAMGSLGFRAGDTFVYGYAYTTSDLSKFVFDNIVTLNIR